MKKPSKPKPSRKAISPEAVAAINDALAAGYKQVDEAADAVKAGYKHLDEAAAAIKETLASGGKLADEFEDLTLPELQALKEAGERQRQVGQRGKATLKARTATRTAILHDLIRAVVFGAPDTFFDGERFAWLKACREISGLLLRKTEGDAFPESQRRLSDLLEQLRGTLAAKSGRQKTETLTSHALLRLSREFKGWTRTACNREMAAAGLVDPDQQRYRDVKAGRRPTRR